MKVFSDSKLHTLPQEQEGSKQMKTELWTPSSDVEEEAEKEVGETDSGSGDRRYFHNVLFDLKLGGESAMISSMPY